MSVVLSSLTTPHGVASLKAELEVKQATLKAKLTDDSARQALNDAVRRMQDQVDATQKLDLSEALSEPDTEQDRAEVSS